MAKWLNSDLFFRKGSFDGEELSEVAIEDPDYLQNLLDGDFGLDAEDREAIEEALGAAA